MPEIHSPAPSAQAKCALDGCGGIVSSVSRVVDDKGECCVLHAAEIRVLELAELVHSEFDQPAPDLTSCIQAARELVEKLVLVSAYREALARTATNSPAPCEIEPRQSV